MKETNESTTITGQNHDPVKLPIHINSDLKEKQQIGKSIRNIVKEIVFKNMIKY